MAKKKPNVQQPAPGHGCDITNAAEAPSLGATIKMADIDQLENLRHRLRSLVHMLADIDDGASHDFSRVAELFDYPLNELDEFAADLYHRTQRQGAAS
jgi:hypothetical protein